MREKVKEFLTITIGTLLVSIGIYFFKFPNNFSTGGVSGISIILGSFSKTLSAGTLVLIINVILLILGFLFFGRSFGIKTVYSSLLLSFAVYGLEWVYPMTEPLTNQPSLELAFAVMLPGLGSAILFNTGASTGGTDIIAMILKKFVSLNIGKALFCTDAVIALLSAMIFGVETGLFSVLGLLAKSFIVDNVIESINLSKYFTIITDNAEEISFFINKELHRGATVCNCIGAFSNENRKLILTVVSRSQAILLKRYAKKIDRYAFIVISNSSDIIGKGFREAI